MINPRRLIAAAAALSAIGATGCSPDVYQRAQAICNGENVAQNTAALRHDHYLAPNAKVRCGR